MRIAAIITLVLLSSQAFADKSENPALDALLSKKFNRNTLVSLIDDQFCQETEFRVTRLSDLHTFPWSADSTMKVCFDLSQLRAMIRKDAGCYASDPKGSVNQKHCCTFGFDHPSPLFLAMTAYGKKFTVRVEELNLVGFAKYFANGEVESIELELQLIANWDFIYNRILAAAADKIFPVPMATIIATTSQCSPSELRPNYVDPTRCSARFGIINQGKGASGFVNFEKNSHILITAFDSNGVEYFIETIATAG